MSLCGVDACLFAYEHTVSNAKGAFVFMSLLIRLIFSESDHRGTRSHYPNLQLHYSPAPPQGGQLNQPMLLIS